MKKTTRTYKVAKKKQEKKKEQRPTSVQLDSYVSYYDLFKSLGK